uniref:Sulfhydryl oxidase n=1 Tax=Corethron hystrix TaxID=216773 RepID=A0A7S1BI24_9STRA|mmetsp:Transcript_27337/g.62756  ORF Transcript_27337/g.62756 Transcript_27337/m.62756 type:complete len:127 (+) Transcript_27337:332-712(+)
MCLFQILLFFIIRVYAQMHFRLHTTAAYYPIAPSTTEQYAATAFMRSISRLYPCAWCRDDFHQALKQNPVKAESREALCKWVCEQHNLINEKLGKEQFSCDMENLDRRWRGGDPRCYGDEESGVGD